jgi:hypothetical protein
MLKANRLTPLDRAMAEVEAEDAFIDFLNNPQPCKLCGTLTDYVATRVLYPPHPPELGIPLNAPCGIAIPLCESCFENDGVKRCLDKLEVDP